jgi:hypothetical protein
MPSISGRYTLNFELDAEGAVRVMPKGFFDEDGKLVAKAAEIAAWLDNGGRERLQIFFAADADSIGSEGVDHEFIDIEFDPDSDYI